MLNQYVRKIKVATEEEEAKKILASFFVRSLIDSEFKNQIIDEIEKDDKIE